MRSRGRTSLRIAGRIVKVTLIVIAALVLSVLLFASVGLELRPVRERVRREVVTLASEALGAPVEIDEIERLSPFRVRVSGIRLLGPDGLPVASVGRLTAYLDPFALIAMRVHIVSARIEHPSVDLGDLDAAEGGRGGLLDVLAQIPKTDPEPEAENQESGLVIDVNRVAVAHASARALVDGKTLRLIELQAHLDLRVSDQTEVDLHELTMHVERDGFAAGYVRSARASYRAAEPIEADLVLISGATKLELEARLGPADLLGAWPLDTRLRIQALEPSTLYAWGLDPEPLHAPIDLDLEASGSTYDLHYALRLGTPGGDAELEGSARALAPEGDQRRTVDALLVTSDLDLRSVLHVDVAPLTLELRASLTSEDAFESMRSTLELSNARYAGDALPHVNAQARYARVVGLQVDELVASYPSGTRLTAHGRYSDSGAIRAEASFETYELRDIPVLERQAPGLCGALSADLRFARDDNGMLAIDLKAGAAGLLLDPLRSELLRVSARADGKDFESLRIDARVLATRGQLQKERFDSLALDVSGGPGRYGASVQLEHERGGRATADGKLSYRRAKLEVRDLLVRYHGATLRADLDYAPRGTSRVKATLDAPDLERITKPWMETPVRGALKLEINGALDRDEAAIEIAASDRRGPLLQTQLRAALSNRKGGAFRGVDTLLANAWEANVELKARRIDELPVLRKADVPPTVMPATVAVRARLKHEPGSEPVGDATLSAYWLGPTKPELEVAPVRCGQRGKPRFDVEAHMKNGDLEALARAMLDGKPVASIRASASAPLNEWLKPKSPRPVSVGARFDRLPLEDLPIVCEEVKGELSGTAELSRALTQAVAVGVDLQARKIRWGTAPALDAQIKGKADQQRVALSGKIASAGGHAYISARVPIDVGGRAPTIDVHKPTDVTVRLRDMNVQALLAPVPALSARSGKLRGDLHMNAPLLDPSFQGRLHLENVGVVLRDVGQPLERVNSEIVLEGKTVRLLETSVHDGAGSARVSGVLYWKTLSTWNAKLTARAEDLPIRRQGVILARLDGRMSAYADFSPKARRLQVRMSRAVIELTNADFGGIQTLEANPEIVLVDDPSSQLEKDLDANGPAPAPPIVLTFDASEPFWVRRDDFSALVSTKLAIVLHDQEPRVSGAIEIQRGFVQLVGQPFDIKSGRIQLVGGHGVEPVLQLRAERRPPGGGGTVAIEANGPLRQPKLEFFVDDEAVTAGEALAAASGARSEGSEASVQDELGGMATGILAGVLTLGARRELGELVPVIGIETGANSTSLRAGIGARKLVPKALRSIVKDVYVEGVLTENEDTASAGDEQEGRSQTQASVLLDLRFPYDLVGEAQYEPGQRWSLDLSWEP